MKQRQNAVTFFHSIYARQHHSQYQLVIACLISALAFCCYIVQTQTGCLATNFFLLMSLGWLGCHLLAACATVNSVFCTFRFVSLSLSGAGSARFFSKVFQKIFRKKFSKIFFEISFEKVFLKEKNKKQSCCSNSDSIYLTRHAIQFNKIILIGFYQ